MINHLELALHLAMHQVSPHLVVTQGSHDNTCATFNCTFLLRAWATKLPLAC